ncbi:MAG: hypothetical protein IJ604_11265 [Prevotella sp.]|nr:hypothetical protein [Prevotella sp.]
MMEEITFVLCIAATVLLLCTHLRLWNHLKVLAKSYSKMVGDEGMTYKLQLCSALSSLLLDAQWATIGALLPSW